MPISTQTQVETQQSQPAKKLVLRAVAEDDWKTQLQTQGLSGDPTIARVSVTDGAGWAVVRGVIPRERAEKHADAAYAYLESFGLGFDRNDRSTWTPEKMPHFYKGGLFVNYGVGHEQFIWDIK